MSLQAIHSPLPGVFYRRSSPEATPFTEVGASIAPGDPVGLIEVMKQFIQIESDIAGVVTEILVADGEPVEAGQLLMHVED